MTASEPSAASAAPESPNPTAAIYILVTAAAATRLASGLADDGGSSLLHASAAAWVAAFALFVLVYGPMLLRRRIDPS